MTETWRERSKEAHLWPWEMVSYLEAVASGVTAEGQDGCSQKKEELPQEWPKYHHIVQENSEDTYDSDIYFVLEAALVAIGDNP